MLENIREGNIEELILDTPRIRIGRITENNIVLKDASVSRYHTEIRDANGNFSLVDLESINGTFLNNEKVLEETVLNNGDVIRIGNFKLTCVDIHFVKVEKKALLSFNTLDKIHILSTVDLFQGLLFDDLAAISRVSHTFSFEAGTLIFRQNDPGDSLFMVIEGEVDIFLETNGAEKLIKTFKPYEYFGEISILNEYPRTSTAKVKVPSKLLQIWKDDFRELLRSHPTLTFALLRLFSSRIHQLDERFDEHFKDNS